MGRASAIWACTHPAYDVLGGGGYKCLCGTKSPTMGDHLTHVLNAHPHGDEIARLILSARQYERWKQGHDLWELGFRPQGNFGLGIIYFDQKDRTNRLRIHQNQNWEHFTASLKAGEEAYRTVKKGRGVDALLAYLKGEPAPVRVKKPKRKTFIDLLREAHDRKDG